MDEIKILLVDDHAIMRDGIRALLGLNEDIKIVGEASDGRVAIKKAEELVPDIILMDIAMPGMDGLEATHHILKHNPRAKIIVLTQYDNREYILSAIKAGAVGYVSKRALGSELVGAIKAVHRGDSFLYPSAAAALIEEYRQRDKISDPYDQLTSREREILKLIAEGHTSQQIASMLVISSKTVLGHRSRIMTKLSLHNRTELIKYAMRRGLVSLDT
jgi:DNA-binding NarL/FixJ family response regulator